MRSTSAGSYADRDVRGALSSARADLPRPRRVLLTNDDGPDSPFFHKFAEGLRNQLNWPTFVCIPSSNWSYVSKSLKPPEGPFEVDFTHSKTDAEQEARCPISPASCVNLGLYELAKDCDLVVSGPNIGESLGHMEPATTSAELTPMPPLSPPSLPHTHTHSLSLSIVYRRPQPWSELDLVFRDGGGRAGGVRPRQARHRDELPVQGLGLLDGRGRDLRGGSRAGCDQVAVAVLERGGRPG